MDKLQKESTVEAGLSAPPGPKVCHISHIYKQWNIILNV